MGQRIKVNKFSRRGRCFPSSKTRRGGAESDREWRGVQAAPWFVIEAVKIGNSWNVVKEDVTVSPERVREIFHVSAVEGVADYCCLPNIPDGGTGHGRGEADVVIGECIGRLNTEP